MKTHKEYHQHAINADALRGHLTLATIPGDWDILFVVDGAPLEFYRTKVRGDKLLAVELSESDNPEHAIKSKHPIKHSSMTAKEYLGGGKSKKASRGKK